MHSLILLYIYIFHLTLLTTSTQIAEMSVNVTVQAKQKSFLGLYLLSPLTDQQPLILPPINNDLLLLSSHSFPPKTPWAWHFQSNTSVIIIAYKQNTLRWLPTPLMIILY